MKARQPHDDALRQGDLVVLDLDFHRCGGPKTGEWREHRARRAVGEPATHRVVRAFSEHDQVTGSTFRHVDVELLGAADGRA